MYKNIIDEKREPSFIDERNSLLKFFSRRQNSTKYHGNNKFKYFIVFLFMIGFFHFINCDDNKKNRIFVLLNENFATIQFDNFLLGDTFSFLQF